MSRRYKFHDQDRLYFVTYAVVNWIDVFTRPEYKNIVLDSLQFCIDKKGLEVYAWCIMSNHVHLIIGTHDDKMENILRDHKSYTAEALINAIKSNPAESRKDWMIAQFSTAGKTNSNNTNYQFWQQHNKPIEIYTPKIIFKYMDYLHNNPVKAGFVAQPEHWLYSSARDYADAKGLLDGLILIDKAIWG